MSTNIIVLGCFLAVLAMPTLSKWVPQSDDHNYETDDQNVVSFDQQNKRETLRRPQLHNAIMIYNQAVQKS